MRDSQGTSIRWRVRRCRVGLCRHARKSLPQLSHYASAAGFVQAQTIPPKPLRIIVPVAGGSSDILSRLIGQRMAEQMGVGVIVENRPGAGTVIGTEIVAKAPADGSTLLAVAAEFVINPSLRKLPYDPLKDFTCVTQLAAGSKCGCIRRSVKKPRRSSRSRNRVRGRSLWLGGSGQREHLAGVCCCR